MLYKSTVGVQQTLNLSVLEFRDLFRPSLDFTMKYCWGYKLFPENILTSRTP